MRSGAVRHAAPCKVDRLSELFDVIEQLRPVPKCGVSYLEHSSDDQLDVRTLFFHDTKSMGRRALLFVETEWDEVTAIVPPAPHTYLDHVVNRMIGESFVTREIGQLGLKSIQKYALDTAQGTTATITREYESQLVSRQGGFERMHDSVRFNGSIDPILVPESEIRMAANALSVIDDEEFGRIEQMIARLDDR